MIWSANAGMNPEIHFEKEFKGAWSESGQECVSGEGGLIISIGRDQAGSLCKWFWVLHVFLGFVLLSHFESKHEYKKCFIFFFATRKHMQLRSGDDCQSRPPSDFTHHSKKGCPFLHYSQLPCINKGPRWPDLLTIFRGCYKVIINFSVMTTHVYFCKMLATWVKEQRKKSVAVCFYF